MDEEYVAVDMISSLSHDFVVWREMRLIMSLGPGLYRKGKQWTRIESHEGAMLYGE